MDKKCIREQTTIRLPEELKEELQREADRRTSQKGQKEVDVRILNKVKTDPDKLKDYITNTLGLEWEEPNIK